VAAWRRAAAAQRTPLCRAAGRERARSAAAPATLRHTRRSSHMSCGYSCGLTRTRARALLLLRPPAAEVLSIVLGIAFILAATALWRRFISGGRGGPFR
jgi:hypothetical protein